MAGQHMMRRRPPLLEPLVVDAIPDGSCVVDERVIPDVKDVVVVPRNGHAPIDGRPRHADVADLLSKESENFLAVPLWADLVGICLVVREQLVGKGAQLEEVVVLDHVLGRLFMDPAVPIVEFVLGVVRLA
jgi:hypothetical protein